MDPVSCWHVQQLVAVLSPLQGVLCCGGYHVMGCGVVCAKAGMCILVVYVSMHCCMRSVLLYRNGYDSEQLGWEPQVSVSGGAPVHKHPT